MNQHMREAIKTYVGTIPPHIQAIAGAIRYDLYHGPTWARIPGGDVERFTSDDFATDYESVAEDKMEGDVIAQTYDSILADALRAYAESLPGVLYWQDWTGDVTDSEPEGYFDKYENEDGETVEEWIEPDGYCEIDSRDILAALFGDFLAKEFF